MSISWVPYAHRGIHGAWRDSVSSASSLRAAWLKVAFKENEPKHFLPEWRLTLCCRSSIGAPPPSVWSWELPDTRLAGRLHEAEHRSWSTLWLRTCAPSVVKSFRTDPCGRSTRYLLPEWFSAT